MGLPPLFGDLDESIDTPRSSLWHRPTAATVAVNRIIAGKDKEDDDGRGGRDDRE